MYLGRPKYIFKKDYWRGGLSGQGVVVEEVKRGKKAPSRLKCTKTALKTSGFAHILA
jgi:hypothetical protein